jgi:Na+/melibiose symporter-like transporter
MWVVSIVIQNPGYLAYVAYRLSSGDFIRWTTRHQCQHEYLMHCSSVSYDASQLHSVLRLSKSVAPGAIVGQVFVGLLCDRLGRKVALLSTTALIVIGATLGTVAQGAHGSTRGLFWFLTIARGIAGVVCIFFSRRISFSNEDGSIGCGRGVPCIVYQCQ